MNEPPVLPMTGGFVQELIGENPENLHAHLDLRVHFPASLQLLEPDVVTPNLLALPPDFKLELLTVKVKRIPLGLEFSSRR